MTLSRPAQRSLLAILAIVKFVHIIDFMIIMPLGPQINEAFGINSTQFGIIVASYSLSAALAGLFTSQFIDRFDRKLALVISFIGFTAGTFACAVAPSYELLIAARLVAGAFGGLLNTLVFAIIGDVFPFNRRSSAMGVVMMSFSVASVVGVPLGIFIAAELGWKAPFLILAGLSVLVGILMWIVVPTLSDHLVGGVKRQSLLQTLTRIARKPSQVNALSLMAFVMLGQLTVIPYYAQYIKFNVGFSDQELAWIYLFGGAATLISSPIIGRLSDRFGNHKVYPLIAALSVIPLYLNTNLSNEPMWLVLICSTLFFLLIGGRMVPAMGAITSSALTENRASFMSINTTIQNLFSSVGTLIGGMIIFQQTETSPIVDFEYTGYVAIFFTLISIPIMMRVRPADDVVTKPAT